MVAYLAGVLLWVAVYVVIALVGWCIGKGR